MVQETFQLTAKEISILAKSCGKKLLRLETEQEPDPDDMFWWNIRLLFEDYAFQISCDLVPGMYFDDTEDFARLSVEEDSPMTPVFTKLIGKTVEEIHLIANTIEIPIREPENLDYKVFYPKAILFLFSDSALIFERQWHFMECMNIRQTPLHQYEIDDDTKYWQSDEPDEPSPIIHSQDILIASNKK